MNVNKTSNMVQRSISKVVSCSTPEHQIESPSGDSDSEAASPVPFLCTQDGAEGITDVVWNYYTPKAEQNGQSRVKNTTPLSRKNKKIKPKLIEKPPQRRRVLRSSHTKTELFQDLLELNKNLHELICKKTQKSSLVERHQSGSEDDIFSDSNDHSPKSGLRTSSRCLRKSILSSKFCKPESETLESDDSMNECLIKASQVVEENVLTTDHTEPKRVCKEDTRKLKTGYLKMDNDSMDAILNNIKLESPIVSKTKKYNLNNDSFDCLVGDLNDSALERLSQMPAKKETPIRSKDTDWTIKELIVHDGTPTKSIFGRHSSMPESPSVVDNRPSTSGMVFGRYNSMPFHQNGQNPGDSPIKCTQDEIKKKHQQAREKLLAKRLLPFTATQQNSQNSNISTQMPESIPLKTSFQPRVASSSTINQVHRNMTSLSSTKEENNPIDLKLLIEKKRQEALMKLRKRQLSK